MDRCVGQLHARVIFWHVIVMWLQMRNLRVFCQAELKRLEMIFVLFPVSIFVLLLVVGFLSFSLYVFYQHWRYRHIPGQPRDGFFWGNIPFIQNQSKRVPGSGKLILMIRLSWHISLLSLDLDTYFIEQCRLKIWQRKLVSTCYA